MKTHPTPNPRRYRLSLERLLKLLSESKSSSAIVRADLFGQVADGWNELLEAGKPLGLTQAELLGLFVHHSYPAVLKAIKREVAARQADWPSLEPAMS